MPTVAIPLGLSLFRNAPPQRQHALGRRRLGAVHQTVLRLPLLHSLGVVLERPREVCIRRCQPGLCLPPLTVLARPRPRFGPSNLAIGVANGADPSPTIAAARVLIALPKRGSPPTNCATSISSSVIFFAIQLNDSSVMPTASPSLGSISFSGFPIAMLHGGSPCFGRYSHAGGLSHGIWYLPVSSVRRSSAAVRCS